MPTELPDLELFRRNAVYRLVVDSHDPGSYVVRVLFEDDRIVFFATSRLFFFAKAVLEKEAQLLTVRRPLERI